MNLIGEMMKIGVSKGFAFNLLKKYPKKLKEKIIYFNWLKEEKKAYSPNYFVKIAESGETGYWYDGFLERQSERESLKKLKSISNADKDRHEIFEEKIGEDKNLTAKKKNILNFIKND